MKKALTVLLAVTVGLARTAGAVQPPILAADTLNGVVLAEAGDYDAAIGVLEGVVHAPRDRERRDLATAYLYLGLARLGKRDEAKARRMFASALGLDPLVSFRPGRLPARAAALLESVRAARSSPKGKGSAAGAVLGLAGAGAGIYALARNGGEDAPPSGAVKTEVIAGALSANQPASSLTLVSTAAGSWRASLVFDEPKAALRLEVFDGNGAAVAKGSPDGPLSLTTTWQGTAGTTYRIDWALDPRSAGDAKYTLTVTHPAP